MSIFFTPYEKKRGFEPLNNISIEERLPRIISAQEHFEVLGVSRNIAEDFFSRLPFEGGVSLIKPTAGTRADFLIKIGDSTVPIKFTTQEGMDLKDMPKDIVLIVGDIQEFYRAYLKGLENDETIEHPANNLSEKERQKLLSQLLTKLPKEFQGKLAIKSDQKDGKLKGAD